MDSQLLALWAKKTEGQPPFHYPLVFHMIDTAAVAESMWDKVLQAGTRKFLAEQLGVSESQAKLWLSFWVSLHDVGKATPAFQALSNHAKERLRGLGFDFKVCDEVRHNVATVCILQELLKSRLSLPHDLSRRIAFTVGGHHGVFPLASEQRPLSRLGSQIWRDQWHKLVDALSACYGVDRMSVSTSMPQSSFFILLAGLTAVADWVASNEEWFPYTGGDFPQMVYSGIDEHLDRSRRRSEKAVCDLLWEFEVPKSPLSFADCFGFPQIRPLQEEIVWLASKLRGQKGIVVIEAPMGEGKTEAALYLADSWLSSLGQKGCYFALPTQATSNQMFGRIKLFLERRFQDGKVALMLLHGHASLWSEFSDLFQRVHIASVDTDGESSYDRTLGAVVAAEWFTYRKRGLLAPFGVGTIDQALLSVLQTKHFFVRLFGLASKTVIFDEVHAYDVYMMTLLERVIEWLAALGSSVVVLSATLPQHRRDALLKAYCRGSGNMDISQQLHSTTYPCISWATNGEVDSRPIDPSPRSIKEMRIRWINGSLSGDDDFELGKYLQEALGQGGCAAVICNTVDYAQKVYLALKKYFPGTEDDGKPQLDLLHARYPFVERDKREKRVLLRFGKSSDLVDCGDDGVKQVVRPRRSVLVSTQIIEQSLDLDFDLMVTEMAPVDLLLQRAGRLQRHERRRPEHFQNRLPELWILRPQLDSGGIPHFGSGTEAVYQPHILLRSWLLLREKQTIKVPDDVQELVEKVYGEHSWKSKLSPSLQEKWQETLEQLEKERDKYQDMARHNSILYPSYRDDILARFNKGLEEENPEVHQSLQALTRVSESPSVQVLCLYGSNDRPLISPDATEVLSSGATPSGLVARKLLERSLNISHSGVVACVLKEGTQVYEEWRKNPLLRHHYVLFFDQQGVCSLGDYMLRLDPELGLVIKRQT